MDKQDTIIFVKQTENNNFSSLFQEELLEEKASLALG